MVDPTQAAPTRLDRALLAAPLIFALHALEEAPTFVEWFNAHVQRSITSDTFWSVNATGLLITVVVVVLHWSARSPATLTLAIAWLSCIMLTNGVFHAVGAIVDRGYVPGLVTALVLYLPFSIWVLRGAWRSGQIPPAVIVVASLLGGAPMAVHGYRILFLGTRLF